MAITRELKRRKMTPRFDTCVIPENDVTCLAPRATIFRPQLIMFYSSLSSSMISAIHNELFCRFKGDLNINVHELKFLFGCRPFTRILKDHQREALLNSQHLGLVTVKMTKITT